MDKVQKQLIDTYFRKRKIAMKEITLKTYESKYGIINNLINFNDLNNDDIRTEYFNLKYGTDFVNVHSFDNSYGKGIALARYGKSKNYSYTLINTEGKESIEGVDYDEIYSYIGKAAYINVKYNKNFLEVFEYDDNFPENHIVKIQYGSSEIPFFVNNKFEFDVGKIKLDNINQNCFIAITAYFNSKFNKKYNTVSVINHFENGTALATNTDFKKIFINLQGEPYVGTLTPEKIIEKSKNRYKYEIEGFIEAYNNTLNLLNNNNN